MASHRLHRRHTLEEINNEIERRRAADNEADREYTTPERLAALRGEDLTPTGVEEAGAWKPSVRASPSAAPEGRRTESAPQTDFDGEVEERIREEIDDFEREGSCAPRGAGLRGADAARMTEGGDRGGRRAAKGQFGGVPGDVRVEPGLEGATEASAAGERAPSRRPEEHAPSRSRATTGREPQSRQIDYRAAAPDGFAAMSRLEAYVRRCGLEARLLELVELRVSQLNGSAYCVDIHKRGARRAGEAEQRIDALEAWRQKRLFTQRERAALAWAEAVTRLVPGQVNDRTFRLVREQFNETELVNLTMAIITINGWNRLAIAFRAERGAR